MALGLGLGLGFGAQGRAEPLDCAGAQLGGAAHEADLAE